MPEPAGIRPAAPAGAVLAEYAPELYEDLRLMPLLRRLMNISCRLTEAVGGSISIVECPGQRYTKIATDSASNRDSALPVRGRRGRSPHIWVRLKVPATVFSSEVVKDVPCGRCWVRTNVGSDLRK